MTLKTPSIVTLPLLIAAMMTACASGVFGQGTSLEILRRIDALNSVFHSLRSEITMIQISGKDQVSKTSVGSMLLQRVKDKSPSLRVEWTSPRESMAMTGQKYVRYSPGEKLAVKGAIKDERQTYLRALLADFSKKALIANWFIAYVGDEKIGNGTMTFHLIFTPKNDTTYKTLDCWIDANGMPNQVKLAENNGDTITIMLSRLQSNSPIRKAEFKVKIPRGTKTRKF